MAERLTPSIALTRSSSISALLATASHVLSQWNAVGLDSQQKEWEKQCLEIATFQEQSLTSRKELAETTKNFKKLTDEEKLSGWGALLKNYQTEIDKLTKRSKGAEAAFLSVWNPLQGVQNPAPLISTMMEELSAASKLHEDHSKVLEELKEYETEFNSLKNQEVTIRRLEDKIRNLEKEAEDHKMEIASMEQENVKEEILKLRAEFEAREGELVERVTQARDAKEKTVRLYDESQNAFFALKAKFDEELAAKQSQIELIGEDVERTTLRAETLEREKEALNSQYMDLWKKHYSADASLSSAETPTSGALKKIVEVEAELQRERTQVSNLQEQVRLLEQSVGAARSRHLEDSKTLNILLSDRDKQLSEMKVEIAGLPTHEQVAALRKQLKMLQIVAYNVQNHDGDLDEADGDKIGTDSPTIAAESDSDKMEALLLAKNRAMESRYMKCKDTLAAALRDLDDERRKLAEIESKCAQQGVLIAKLEEDICLGSAAANSGSSVTTTITTTATLTMVPSLGNAPPVKDDFTPEKFGKQLMGSARVGEGSEVAIVEVVSRQRDRFRDRCIQLESEKASLERAQQAQRAQIEALQSDNVNLYGKIKYLQSYNGTRQGRQDIESGDAVEEKYKNKYEEGMNPFQRFTLKEKARQYQELSVPERITYNLSSFFLSNSLYRKFLFFYMVALHLLVFITIYTLVLSSPKACPRIPSGASANQIAQLAAASAAAASNQGSPNTQGNLKLG